MICGNCGLEVSSTSKFCCYCGKPLTPAARFCGECGAELEPEFKFCVKCGVRIQAASASRPIQAAPIQKQAQVIQRAHPATTVTAAVIEPKRVPMGTLDLEVNLDERCRLVNAGIFSYVVLHIQPDGLIWFDKVPSERFRLIGFSWGGPRYEEHSVTVGKGKTKRKGRVLGAVVGTVIAPGIGTAIGAAVGTGNKEDDSRSVTKTSVEEIETVAVLTLCNVRTGESGTMKIKGTSDEIGPVEQFAKRVLL